MRSYYSTVLDQTAERTWHTLRDFNGLSTWFAAGVSESRIEDGRSGDSTGAIRRFVMGEDVIRERLLAHSDQDRSYTYEFVPPAPFPVSGYAATLRVTPVTDGDRAFVEWWADFDCEVDEHQKWRTFFAMEVFAPALAALRHHLAA